MVWPALLVVALGAIYVVVPYVCEPRIKGRAKSLAIPYLPFAFWLAYLTLQGVWTKSFLMMILPPALVLVLCLHTLWMFRAAWKDKAWRYNASASAHHGDQPDRDNSGDSYHS